MKTEGTHDPTASPIELGGWIFTFWILFVTASYLYFMLKSMSS